MANTVILIPYKRKGNHLQLLLKSEFVPGWDAHPDLCGLLYTDAEGPLESAIIKSFKKESSILIEGNELIRLGVCAVKRNSDHMLDLYAVDLSKRSEPAFDPEAKLVWADEERVVESIDAHLLAAYARLKFLLFS